jgi:hypothetical protein
MLDLRRYLLFSFELDALPKEPKVLLVCGDALKAENLGRKREKMLLCGDFSSSMSSNVDELPPYLIELALPP